MESYYDEDGRNRNGSSLIDSEDMPEDQFYWEWEEFIPIKNLSKHYGSCPAMKKKYGKLFGSIDKLLTNDSKNLQDWKSLEMLFKFLQGHVKVMINKEKKKPSKFKHLMKKKSAPIDASMEEEIIDSSKLACRSSSNI